jgi:hypothetical protein
MIEPFADPFPEEMTGPTMPDIPGLGASKSPASNMEAVGAVAIERENPKSKTKAKVKTKTAKVKPAPVKESKPTETTEGPDEPRKKLMILRPTYKLVDDLVLHATLATFDRTAMAYDRQGGDAMIYHSRNLLADRFMESGYEWALWWDDDIIPPIGNANWTYSHVPGVPTTYPASFLNMQPIPRLLSHGKTLIGGLYYGRKVPHAPICDRSGEITALTKAPVDAIVPRDWVGTGFLLVHRSVFEDIQKKFPELAPKKGPVNVWEKVWGYFHPSEMQAEDVSFCLRAKASGHQPFVDCGVVCAHLGTAAYGPWSRKS